MQSLVTGAAADPAGLVNPDNFPVGLSESPPLTVRWMARAGMSPLVVDPPSRLEHLDGETYRPRQHGTVSA